MAGAVNEGVLQRGYYVPTNEDGIMVCVHLEGSVFVLKAEADEQVSRTEIKNVEGLKNSTPEFLKNCIASVQEDRVNFAESPLETQKDLDLIVAAYAGQLSNSYPASKKPLSDADKGVVLQMLECGYKQAGKDEEKQKKVATIVAAEVEGWASEEPFDFVGSRGEPYIVGVDDVLIAAAIGAFARIVVAAIRHRTAKVKAAAQIKVAEIQAKGTS